MRTACLSGAFTVLLAALASGSARAALGQEREPPPPLLTLPSEQRLELELLSDPERVRVRVHMRSDEPVHLLVGDPWHGGASIDVRAPGRRVLPPADPQRVAGWDLPIPAASVRGGVYEVEVSGAGFGSEPVAVQALGLGRRVFEPARWTSTALVLQREDGVLRVREHADWARARSTPRALAWVAVLAGALALHAGARAWRRRVRHAPSSRAPRLELALAALIALAALGWRMTESASMPEALGGARALPLVWPSEWPLVGPRAPHALGADFAELSAALDRERRPGERVCVLYSGGSSDGTGILRFAHLADLYPDLRVLLRGHQRLEPGLYVCVDFQPAAPALWSCVSGGLLRVARGRDT